MRLTFLTLLAAWFTGTAALAGPLISERVETYPINATTIDGLIRQMRAEEPKGYWAQTRWFVRWSGGCAVEVDVIYRMPEHENPTAMPPDVRQKFETMWDRLMDHERQHGQHGIRAGQEIHLAKCAGAHDIIKKYNQADLDYDRRTDHGSSEGVVLK